LDAIKSPVPNDPVGKIELGAVGIPFTKQSTDPVVNRNEI
jgi:hypothetical protein